MAFRVTNRPRATRSRESVQVSGFDDLYAQLTENLPKVTQRAVLQRAGKAAMEPMQARATELAHQRSGATRRSIRLTTRVLKATARLGAAIRVQLSAGDKDTYWAKFEERGTIHMAAIPFMRPAFDEQSGETVARLKAALQTEMGKAIARRAKRLARLGN